MNKKRLIRLGIIIICLYLIVTTSQSLFDLWRAGDKLTSREKALAALQKQRDELWRQKKTVESPDYLEKVARDQLGLSKPGEDVIIVPPELIAEKAREATAEAMPNWKRWWRLFF